jgi:hypothetical protein
MKVRCYFKDPDTMPDAVSDAVHKSERPSGISVGEWQSIKASRTCEVQSDIVDKWMDYGEYIMVEFDTDAGTATVIPRSEIKQ